MNKIILITTEGCQGCAIMRNSINQALAITSKEITFVQKDFKELDKKQLAATRVKDFPTTFFVKDDLIVRKESGTRPYIVVLRWIDVDFK